MQTIEPGITKLSNDQNKIDFFDRTIRAVVAHADQIVLIGQHLSEQESLRTKELERIENERELARAKLKKKPFGGKKPEQESVVLSADDDPVNHAVLDDEEENAAAVDEVLANEQDSSANVELPPTVEEPKTLTSDDFSFIRDDGVRALLATLPSSVLCEAKFLRSSYRINADGYLTFEAKSDPSDSKAPDAELIAYIAGTCLNTGEQARIVYVSDNKLKDGQTALYPFDGCLVTRLNDGTLHVVHAPQPEVETWWYIGCHYLRMSLYRKPGLEGVMFHSAEEA